jgi:hypothetical protein
MDAELRKKTPSERRVGSNVGVPTRSDDGVAEKDTPPRRHVASLHQTLSRERPKRSEA